jgi:hypothetical protein
MYVATFGEPGLTSPPKKQSPLGRFLGCLPGFTRVNYMLARGLYFRETSFRRNENAG